MEVSSDPDPEALDSDTESEVVSELLVDSPVLESSSGSPSEGSLVFCFAAP